MVKYLSDNRTDPRFETILTRPQPFQGEVPEVKYAPDEIDLTPAIKAASMGVNVYYKQKGEELEREGMAISHSLYEANRAAQQARQREASAKEKKTEIKNTMLNDWGEWLRQNVINRLDQDPNYTMTMAAREIRTARPIFLQNMGGVASVNDLVGVESNLGVNFDKSFMQMDFKLMEEQNKAIQKMNREAITAEASSILGMDPVTGKPNVDKYTFDEQVAITSGANRLYSLADSSLRADKEMGMSEPSQRSNDYTLKNLVANFRAERNNYQDLTWADVDALVESKADEIYTGLSQYGLGIDRGQARYMARKAAEMAGYFGDVTYADGMLSKGLESKKKLAEYATLDSDTQLKLMENQSKIRQQQTIAAIANGDEVGAGDLIHLQFTVPETQAKTLMQNPQFMEISRNAIKEMKIKEGTTGTSAGHANAVIVNRLQNPDTKREFAKAVYQGAENINSGNSVFGAYAGPWGVGVALAGVHNDVTTVQPQDADKDATVDTDTRQRIENTRLPIDMFEKAYKDGVIEEMSPTEQAQHFEQYFKDIAYNAASHLTTLVNHGWLENLRYDEATKRLVVVNVDPSQKSFIEPATGAETLWPQVDALNRYFNAGVNYYDLMSSDKFKDTILQAYKIKPLQADDKLFTKTDLINFMQGNYDISNTGAAVGAMVGGIFGGIPGAAIGGAIGSSGQTGFGAAWDLVDAFFNLRPAVRKISGGDAKGALEELSQSKASKAAEFVTDKIIAPGLELGGEMVGEAVAMAEKIGEAPFKAGEALEKAAPFVSQVVNLGRAIAEEAKQEPYRETAVADAIRGKEIKSAIVDAIESMQPIVNLADTEAKAIEKFAKDLESKEKEAIKLAYPSIPLVNLKTISKVMKGEEVSSEEAAAALKAYNQASLGDKRKLDKRYNIGVFSRNIESTLKDFVQKKKEVIKDSSKKARSLKEEYIPGIL